VTNLRALVPQFRRTSFISLYNVRLAFNIALAGMSRVIEMHEEVGGVTRLLCRVNINLIQCQKPWCIFRLEHQHPIELEPPCSYDAGHVRRCVAIHPVVAGVEARAPLGGNQAELMAGRALNDLREFKLEP
jgi:hypothetical protein